MRALVLYESMFGNTRQIAEAIGIGLSQTMEVRVVPVAEATSVELGEVDLLVVGAPIHAWGLSRPTTRKAALGTADQPGSDLTLEPGAEGAGVREWLATTTLAPAKAAAFDTRMKAPLGLSGSAARKIARKLRRRGFAIAIPPRGFLVSRQNRLMRGEIASARQWGELLGARLAR